MIKSVMAAMIKDLIIEQDRRKATNKRPIYQAPMIPKECFRLRIRAVWDAKRERMKYYFGYQELNFVGSSWIDKHGVFQKSETLKKFITKYNLLS